MKIYLACTINRENQNYNKELFVKNHLESYWALKDKKNNIETWTIIDDLKNNNIFLDSGAYSAFTKKVVIDIQEYISFIKRYKEHLTVYSVLDVVGDPSGTWKNQMIMEKAGLEPLPCFHYGENLKYLKKYIDNYEYISLGGMVPISPKSLQIWLDKIFTKSFLKSAKT